MKTKHCLSTCLSLLASTFILGCSKEAPTYDKVGAETQNKTTQKKPAELGVRFETIELAFDQLQNAAHSIGILANQPGKIEGEDDCVDYTFRPGKTIFLVAEYHGCHMQITKGGSKYQMVLTGREEFSNSIDKSENLQLHSNGLIVEMTKVGTSTKLIYDVDRILSLDFFMPSDSEKKDKAEFQASFRQDYRLQAHDSDERNKLDAWLSGTTGKVRLVYDEATHTFNVVGFAKDTATEFKYLFIRPRQMKAPKNNFSGTLKITAQEDTTLVPGCGVPAGKFNWKMAETQPRRKSSDGAFLSDSAGMKDTTGTDPDLKDVRPWSECQPVNK